MKGYLMQEKEFNRGMDTFIESRSLENNFGVVFEDDGDTAYFYATENEENSTGQKILDALHIYEFEDGEISTPGRLMIIWSGDWLKCALVLDDKCQALFDFESRKGYNINAFPPANGFWSNGNRELTNEIIHLYF